MGLVTEIIKYLRACVAPLAFVLGAVFDWTNAVVIDDALTRLRRTYNGVHGEEFTGRELYAKFSQLVWDIFAGGGEVYVCCCDITKWVPAEKSREQKQRDQSRPAEKYPPKSEICNEGIRIWVPEVAAQPAQVQPPHRFNIQTLCSSRVQVREKMMRYLCDCFK